MKRIKKGTKFLPRISTTFCNVRICPLNCKVCTCGKCMVEQGLAAPLNLFDYNLHEYAVMIAAKKNGAPFIPPFKPYGAFEGLDDFYRDEEKK